MLTSSSTRNWCALINALLFALSCRPVLAQLQCPPHSKADEVYAKYKHAVFKVIALGDQIGIDTKEFPLGTATLIHPDGYFITAAHIFDPKSNGDLRGKTYQLGKKVLLRKLVDTTAQVETVEAKLVLLGNSQTTDLALLRSTSTMAVQYAYPDLFLGRSYDYRGRVVPLIVGTDVEIMGYPLEQNLLQRFDSIHLNASDRSGKVSLESEPLEGDVKVLLLNGTSGSLAVSRDGRARGVLSGDPKPVYAAGGKALRYTFTPTASIPDDWLPNIPFTQDGNRFLRLLQQSSLDLTDLVWLEAGAQVTSVDLWKIVTAMGPGKKPAGSHLRAYQTLTLRCMCAALNTMIRTDTMSALDAFHWAKQMHVLSSSMAAAGYSAGASAALLNAVTLFAHAETESQFKFGSGYPGQAYVDYGRALEDAWRAYPELKVPVASATSKYDAASKQNPDDIALLWLRQALIAEGLESYRDAKDYALRGQVASTDPAMKSWLNKNTEWYDRKIALHVSDDMLLNADNDQNNWLLYGKDYQSTRYTDLRQVRKANIKRLRPAWDVPFASPEDQASQAVSVNGTVYVTTSFNKVLSVDAVTGRVNWKYERELPKDIFPKLCCDIASSGVAIYKNKVYLATLDAHIVALDNLTGKVVWDKKMGDYTYAETFTIMPMAVRNKIIFGTPGAEYGVRGWIAAIDADTGAPIWKTYTIPGPGEPGNDTWAGESWRFGGGSASITGSYDKETNLLFWPIGNPGPSFDRHVRLGENLFTNSTIALDPDSGRIKSYFSYTPNDPYDYGVNENVLVDIAGKKMWLQASRNGHIYAVDRAKTSESNFGNEHKCVWVTALQRVNWTMPITPSNNCKPTYNWPEKDVVYDRVTTDVAPSVNEGQYSMAYSRRTSMAYVPIYDFSMDLRGKKMEWKRGEWYLGAEIIRRTNVASMIKGFDGATGKQVWSRSRDWPATSGLLATGGGLVFYGDSGGNFNALDDTTGDELWSYNVGSAVHGNPITFTANGKQHLAIVYGENKNSIWPLDFSGLVTRKTKGSGIMAFVLEP